MKRATDRQKVLWFRKSMRLMGLTKPKFYVGDRVRIVKKDAIFVSYCKGIFDRDWVTVKGAWTNLDNCRKERIGQVGIVYKMEDTQIRTIPETDTWNYYIKFDNGDVIVFHSEYLKKVK